VNSQSSPVANRDVGNGDRTGRNEWLGQETGQNLVARPNHAAGHNWAVGHIHVTDHSPNGFRRECGGSA
jgi:hypothetical protein